MKNCEDIAKKLLEGIPSGNASTPFYVLAAGGPASHKCFLHQLLKQKNYKSVVTLNEEVLAEYFPAKDAKYPHHEKNAANVKDYYEVMDAVIKQASQRRISVVVEDHGDYPDIYRRHLSRLRDQGYDNFLLVHTISPSNFAKKIDYLVAHENMPDFKEWGKSYHRRVARNCDALVGMFNKGMVIETCPSYICADGKSQAIPLMRFHRDGYDTTKEILDEERFRTFRSWADIAVSPEFDHYFRATDTVMGTSLTHRRAGRNTGEDGSYGDRALKKASPIERLITREVSPSRA